MASMAVLFDWLYAHLALLSWLSALSVVMFVGSLLLIPWLVVRIPVDYFVRRQHLIDRWRLRHPLLRIAVLAAKNLCGAVLVLAGIAMLVLPGQGILTIVVGLTLLDFPGKFTLEQKLARQPSVLGAMNWIRAKAHCAPLQSPPANPPDPTGSA
jgi:hypothetical protein